MSMTKIATATLGSDAAAISFTSIPGTFTDLMLVVSARRTGVAEAAYINFNGSSSNLTVRTLRGSGSGVSSDNRTDGYIGEQDGSNMTSNTFGNAQIYIPNYAGSTNKSFSVDSVMENNATLAYQQIHAGLWSNTAAITSITLNTYLGGNWLAGSTATLYGVTKGSLAGVTVS